MRYLFAIILPPLAVLSCGKFFAAIFNLILTLFFWIPGVVHALFVVKSYNDKKNFDRLERTITASASVAHQDMTNMSRQLIEQQLKAERLRVEALERKLAEDDQKTL